VWDGALENASTTVFLNLKDQPALRSRDSAARSSDRNASLIDSEVGNASATSESSLTVTIRTSRVRGFRLLVPSALTDHQRCAFATGQNLAVSRGIGFFHVFEVVLGFHLRIPLDTLRVAPSQSLENTVPHAFSSLGTGRCS
jgi:hypothetical protein